MRTSMQDPLHDMIINDDDDDKTVEGSFYPSSFDIKAAGANREAVKTLSNRCIQIQNHLVGWQVNQSLFFIDFLSRIPFRLILRMC